jgi:hypothetical protein
MFTRSLAPRSKLRVHQNRWLTLRMSDAGRYTIHC